MRGQKVIRHLRLDLYAGNRGDPREGRSDRRVIAHNADCSSGATARVRFQGCDPGLQVPPQRGGEDPPGLCCVAGWPCAADRVQTVVGRGGRCCGGSAVRHHVAVGRDGAGDGKRMQGPDAGDGVIVFDGIEECRDGIPGIDPFLRDAIQHGEVVMIMPGVSRTAS